MNRTLSALLSALRGRPACRTARAGRTRLQVEALEDRCLLAWGATPPGSILPSSVTAAVVTVNTQGNAAITANEIDYYTFKVSDSAPAVDTYIINVTTPSSALDTVLGVYDASGLRINFNDDVSLANTDSRVVLALKAGERYYFGVSKLAGTVGGRYTWSIDGPSDFDENNDNRSIASDLGTLTAPFTTPYLSLLDGHDWYRFTMNAAGTAGDRVTIDFRNSQGDLQLELTNAAGKRVGLSAGVADGETISLNGLAAGTYYVHIYGKNGASNPRYMLTIDPGTAPLTSVALDGAGSGSSGGSIHRDADGNPIPNVFEFQATVTGRVSILMRAEQQYIQSLLTVAAPTTVTQEAFVAGQFQGTQDHVIQFDVVAGQTYRFSAGVVIPPDDLPNNFSVAVGDYRLVLSTEPTGSDFSATTPHLIPLDASGSGLQLGTLDQAGDIDLFAITATVTGQTTVRVDGGAGADQVVHFATKSGQMYAVQVSDPKNPTGVYVLTVTSIADDFPDDKVFPIALDATGSGNLKGSINYADDEDVFRFTATQTGTMTLKMQSRADLSSLISNVTVSSTTVRYDLSPSHRSLASAPATDRVLQFEVVKGQQYTVRASGDAGSTGEYLLSLAMAADGVSATIPQIIDLSTGAANLSGSIATPHDRDRFQFTAPRDGYLVVAMYAEPGTNLQGLVTFPPTSTSVDLEDVKSPAARIVTTFEPEVDASGGTRLVAVRLQAFSAIGWQEATRDTFVALRITKGQTYDFLVSADRCTIGDYTLVLTTYPVDPVNGREVAFETKSEGPVGVFGHRTWTFLLGTRLGYQYDSGQFAPERETGKSPDATNTQLVGFRLPGTNPGGTPGPVTVPNGQSTLAANSLIATLLTVAARDNAVQSTDGAAVAKGAAEVTPTLLTLLLVGVVPSGGTDGETAPQIGGTVFEDRDGNGRQDAEERGVAGETVVLEVQDGGKYVVVGTATTDANGTYAFAGVPPGDYRVRRISEPGTASSSATPASYAIKVTADGKPQTLDFRKPSKRTKTLGLRVHPWTHWTEEEVVHFQESKFAEETDRVFQNWGQDNVLLDVRESDRAAMDWCAGLFSMVFAVTVSLANDRQAMISDEKRRLDVNKQTAT